MEEDGIVLLLVFCLCFCYFLGLGATFTWLGPPAAARSLMRQNRWSGRFIKRGRTTCRGGPKLTILGKWDQHLPFLGVHP